MPLAAASIGQVHRARPHDGTPVAVKVQYPGVEKAIAADLDNTALLTQMLGIVFKGLDVGPFIAELKARVGEELDYRLEAERQTRVSPHVRRSPHDRGARRVHDSLSTVKVLVTDLVDRRAVRGDRDWTRPSATSPARRSIASCSAASTAIASSTATRIPATTCSSAAARSVFG